MNVRTDVAVLAGLSAGAVAAVVDALLALGLTSPDAVFFNSLTAGIAAIVLGAMCGLVWNAIRRTTAFGITWAIGGLIVVAITLAASAIVNGLAGYAAPLSVVSFLVVGLLTPLLSRQVIGGRRLVAPVTVVVGLAACAALVSRAAPVRDVAAMPPAAAAPVVAASPVPVERARVVASIAPSPSLIAAAVAAKPTGRQAGQYAGINFGVASGSKATFTVREQLARMPLPNDAVVSTSALTGEVHLDGRPSQIQLDLQRLSSDQPNRDKYIRGTMFANEKAATFKVDDPHSLPEGTAKGQVLDGEVPGKLAIKGGEYPLTFQWQARDDGDVVYLTGHSQFVWSDIGLQAPSSAAIVSADDTVVCDVVLAVRPK
ncbi:MAG: hypothetical protein NVSMB2_21750 [Chloroflexota bacterium]